jgi:hypothetical protein
VEGFEGKERRKRDATPSPCLGALIFSIRLKFLNLRGTEKMNWMRTLEGFDFILIFQILFPLIIILTGQY